MFFPPFRPEDAGDPSSLWFIRNQYGKVLGNHLTTLENSTTVEELPAPKRRRRNPRWAA